MNKYCSVVEACNSVWGTRGEGYKFGNCVLQEENVYFSVQAHEVKRDEG